MTAEWRGPDSDTGAHAATTNFATVSLGERPAPESLTWADIAASPEWTPLNDYLATRAIEPGLVGLSGYPILGWQESIEEFGVMPRPVWSLVAPDGDELNVYRASDLDPEELEERTEHLFAWREGAVVVALDLTTTVGWRMHPKSRPLMTGIALMSFAMDEPSTTETAFTLEVEREVHRLRVREAAKAKFEAEGLEVAVLPRRVGLRDFLAEPDDPIRYRVGGLLPTGGRVVLSAQHKAGKTTVIGSLMRSLVDDVLFLDHFAVEPVHRLIGIDNELSEPMRRRWMRDQGIVNTNRIDLVSLRGHLSLFNILEPRTRSRWAAHLGPADLLVFDCLRPALDALGLSEDKDAGRFLEALDELAAEAGISELLLVHHMGHQGERSRGDSRILDWPDAVWKLVKDAEDSGTSAGAVRRYFSAYGRDVDQSELLLAFDPATRHLSVAGGSRLDARVGEACEAVLAVLTERGERLSGRAIEEHLRDSGIGRDTIRAGLRRAVSDGSVTVSDGPRNSKLHSLASGRTMP